MRVCLLVDRRGHPVLEATARELVDRHGATVTVVDAPALPPPDDADVYLLKSRSDRGIEAARRAEVHGALVINSARATETCLDRKLMAARMWEAGLPFPKTLSAPTLDALIATSNGHELAWPLIVKSRRSRRGDLVRMVSASAELHSLAAEWGNEPVIVQPVVRHNGCEHKLWSVCHRLHAVRRSTAVGPPARGLDIPVSLEQLPEGVEDLARNVGAVFSLVLYGVDVLITDGGPVVVDVNPFPGFRGVPGAAQAIAEHVIGLLAIAKGHQMKTARGSGLARIVTEPAALAGDPDMRPVYVRRKPARGLVALHAGGRHAERIACVRVDEKALRESGARARATLSWFPDDPAMPTLRACCEPRDGSDLWGALQRAAVNATGSPHRMIMAQAEPMRYKPQDRCVIRYQLMLETVLGRSTEVSVVGKVYRQREQAGCVHAIAAHLHRSATPVVPRPLGFVEELGIVLAEDVSSSRSLPGTAALRPSGGREPSEEAVKGAAAALTALHSCSTSDGYPLRSASDETTRVLARADLLAASVPSLAAPVRRAGQLVAEALATTPAGDLCLNHGSFKPSQLIFCEPGRVVVTDLDHCCLADPALDLGYFLAYLRPAALWRGRDVARTWYETAASRFCGAYTAATFARGAPQGVTSALPRARLYEAAIMFKIAMRRVHRLNSPRPRELDAIVNEALSRAMSASQGAW